MPLTAGTHLGSYEVLGLIGSGGMGEVYRARDTRLGREVALKILRDATTGDPRRLERFEREARAAAALSHPNIIVVHDVGSESGISFIVSELLRGTTLREELTATRPWPASRALDVARQIAGALAAAHAQGVVHRDLKPENVFIGADGVVKVLDFGLARLVEPTAQGEASATASMTDAGSLLGTVGYMSPEQVRGQPADHRADIFAFGVILYEMLSGRRAFAEETAAETMTAILLKEPPALDTGAGMGAIPTALARLVSRCLEKRREQRFQSASDLAFALDTLSDSSAATAEAAYAPPGRPATKRSLWRRPNVWATTMAALALAGLALVVGARFMHSVQPGRLRIVRYVPLTHHGVLFPPFPSEIPLATDGPRIYFPEFSNGRIRVSQVAAAGGEPVPLPLTMAENHVLESVSPDGAELLIAAYGLDDTLVGEGPYWVVPLPGGTPRRLGESRAHAAQWLPDGRILYIHKNEILVINRDGTGQRRLMSIPGRAYWPRLSPDGERLTFSLFRENYWSSQLWEVRMDGTGLRPLLPGWNNPPNECCGSWTPDGKYFVFTATRENQSHVWAIRESGRSFDQDRPVPVQLTSGPTQFRRAVPSLDGRRLFAIGWHLRGELTRFDGQLGRLESYMSGLSAEWVDHSPDGRWITYVTYPEAELWRSRVDGTERLQLTAAPLRAIAPKWSPDSAQIAFAGHHPGEEPNVLLVSKEGGGYRQVIAGMDPTWSPDGSSIAVETKTGIQIVDVHTGRATKILAGTRFFSPRWSPDGRRLAAISVDKWKVAIYEFQTGRWSELGPEWTALPIWSRDGKSLFCRDDVRPNIARGVYRLRMPAYRPEHVMIFEQVRLVWGTVPFWIGLTSDDSLLFLRDLSSHELYALDWEAP